MQSESAEQAAMESDNDGRPQTKGRFVKIIAKYLFSHVGLCLLVIAYVVGGAYLFRHLEAAGEEQRIDAQVEKSNEIEADRENLAQLLWNYKNGPDYNTTVALLIEQYHTNVTNAIQNYAYNGQPLDTRPVAKWGVASAILFTVTIVTTIGYGHVTPVTAMGQLTVIGYALLGVPLMLMFLANIGDAMARFLRVAYGKGCCYCCHKKREKEYAKSMEEQRLSKEVRDDQVSAIPSNRPRSAWSNGDASDLRQRKGDAERGRDMVNDTLPQEQITTEDAALRLSDSTDDVINVPISLTLVIIAAYVFLGAILFAAWNNWSWITGAYFSFVTLSTIGFGDLIPGINQLGSAAGTIKLAVSAFYIVLGLAVLSMSFNLMMEEMIAKFEWLGRKLGIIDDPNQPMGGPTDVQPFVPEEQMPATEPERL